MERERPISTRGVPFFDHMLDAFGRHGPSDLTVHGERRHRSRRAPHGRGLWHRARDLLRQGARRHEGHHALRCSIRLPMDETLVAAAVDIAGRGQLDYKVDVPAGILGTFDTSLSEEFWDRVRPPTWARRCTSRSDRPGRNAHHIIEALFQGGRQGAHAGRGARSAHRGAGAVQRRGSW